MLPREITVQSYKVKHTPFRFKAPWLLYNRLSFPTLTYTHPCVFVSFLALNSSPKTRSLILSNHLKRPGVAMETKTLVSPLFHSHTLYINNKDLQLTDLSASESIYMYKLTQNFFSKWIVSISAVGLYIQDC